MYRHIAWIEPLSHWHPLDGVYQRLPDLGHPLTEAFAIHFHTYGRAEDVPEAPASFTRTVWERETPEVREVFRERARRLIRGDLSVLPTYLPPGYAAWVG